jgi:hypothetical protein
MIGKIRKLADFKFAKSKAERGVGYFIIEIVLTVVET